MCYYCVSSVITDTPSLTSSYFVACLFCHHLISDIVYGMRGASVFVILKMLRKILDFLLQKSVNYDSQKIFQENYKKGVKNIFFRVRIEIIKL